MGFIKILTPEFLRNFFYILFIKRKYGYFENFDKI
jgi:hypothetical protein